MAILNKIVNSIRRNGMAETVRLIPKNIEHSFRWHLDGKFDRAYGTNTGHRIELEELHIVSANRSGGVYYEPTPSALFEHIMSELGPILSFNDFTFIDYGSGKGRALLLASNYPFKAIIGVEFSDELHRIAVQNIDLYCTSRRRCRDVSSVHADATVFFPPAGDLLIYFYNPFYADIMRRVLGNLAEAVDPHASRIALIYLHPLSSEVVERSGIFQSRAEIILPFDHTREQQRRCYVYFSWPVAQADFPIQPVLGRTSCESSKGS